MNTRIQKIVDAVKKNGHDGIVISKGSDIKYLTGFTGEYGVAVLLLTDTVHGHRRREGAGRRHCKRAQAGLGGAWRDDHCRVCRQG